MRGFWLGLSLSVAFILGCATARWVAPPVSAQGSSGTRWEYHCVESQNYGGITEKANELGPAGWELVAGAPETVGADAVWCFKRPL